MIGADCGYMRERRDAMELKSKVDEFRDRLVEMRDSAEPGSQRKADLRWMTKRLDSASVALAAVAFWTFDDGEED